MTTNDMQDISTLLEQGAKLEAVKLQKLTTVSFQDKMFENHMDNAPTIIEAEE